MTWTTFGRATAAAAVATALTVAPVWAQRGRGAGMGMPRYDKAAEVTLTGTVDTIQANTGRMMGGGGTHFVLKTSAGLTDVRVGPSSWLAEKNYVLAVGDQLEVTGAKVVIDGKDALMARVIKKGDLTMTLRDESGVPEWAGGGARPK